MLAQTRRIGDIKAHMDRVNVQPGTTVRAAAEGRQHFVGGGAGSVVRLNGNPADYALELFGSGEPGTVNRYALIAVNGSGEYQFDKSVERICFVSGAYTFVRNLPSVIAAGARLETRLANTRPFKSYAQVREDVLLMRALRNVDPPTGFYIDVGAYDPDSDSVTRVFYELGWRGINLEPSPSHHARLQQRRPRDLNLCTAASSTSGHMRFFRNDGEQLGTLEQRFADASVAAEVVEVPVVRLADICKEHVNGDIHFLKIDVEGHERSVLEGCDFTAYRPWIIVMEAVAPNRADVPTWGEWEDVLLDTNYILAGEDELNQYFVANERRHLSRFFALPADNYVSGREVAEQKRLVKEVERLTWKVETLENASRHTPWIKRLFHRGGA